MSVLPEGEPMVLDSSDSTPRVSWFSELPQC